MATGEELLNSLLDSMAPMEENSPMARVMLYGNSGVGKTVLALRVAQELINPGEKILYIDFREGFTTVAVNSMWTSLRKNVVRMRYTGLAQMTSLAMAMEAKVPAVADFKVLILDESSSMADREVSHVCQNRAKKDATKDPDEPKLPDMGVASTRYRNMVDSLESLPIHIIHVAHERVDKDDRSVTVTGPAFMPGLSGKLRENQQIVARVTATETDGGTIRSCTVQPTMRVVAKTRIHGLPSEVTFDHLVDAVKAFTDKHIDITDPAIITE